MKAGRFENRLGECVSALMIAVILTTMSVLIVAPVYAVNVSGNQSGTWTRASSPYIVTGNVNIPAGQTLTIEPGVEVKFNDNLGIQVYGTLNADGTPEAKITFTSNGDLAPDWWRSIQFMDGSAGILDNCIIRYGGYWEDADLVIRGNASPTISNSEISYSDRDGIRLYDDASPTISNSTFSNNGDWPIQRWNRATPRLSGNTFTDNGRNAIYVRGHTIPGGTEVQWDNPGVPYVIESVTIAAGATLNIAAGTIIKLLDNVYIWVNGTLNAVGTEANRIYFTAYTDDTVGGDTNADGSDTTPAGDYWRTIAFDGSGGGTLDYTIIRYGGYWEDTNIMARGTAAPTISNSTISYSDVDGVRTYDAARPSITNSTITNNSGWPVRIRGWNAIADLSGCTIENNGRNGIYVDNHSIPVGQSVEWSVASVPYVIGNVRILSGATLTIPAGMIVKFRRNEYITVAGGGTLNAVGTADLPIIFTAFTDDEFGGDTNADGDNTVPSGGYWNSIYFDNGALGMLSRSVVRYGGYSNRANIVCRGASPTISWTEIAYSSDYGLRLQGAARPVLANNTITRNATWPVYIEDFTAIPDFQNNTIRQNAYDGIRLRGGDVPAGQRVTLDLPTVPYVADNIRVRPGATLNIPAGVIVKFTRNRYLQVDSGGTLSAKGTVDNRVVFTAYTDDYYGGDTNGDGPASLPSGDYWNSLYFYGGSRDTLDYAIIKYGGVSNDANIVFNGDASMATVTNSIIAYSDGAGIRSMSNAQPTVVNNSLGPNAIYGIRVDGTSEVDATNNWWGDPTGPYHPTNNPSGLGVAVTDYVLFDPWLDTPPVVEPPPEPILPGLLSYTVSLTSGLNMFSVPLEPTTPYTAQSLLTMLGGTMIIAMDEGTFITYLPAFGGPGFSIQGGWGYIVNVPSGREITFTGTGWSGGTSKPVFASSELGPVWAFAVGGRLEGAPLDTRYTVVARNLRTGAMVSDQVGSLSESYFAAAWVDLNRRDVVREGDQIEVVLKDPTGSKVAGPVVREVTTEDLRNAVLMVNFKHSQAVPSGFALRQNYPNPFNPETWLPYELAREARVVIRIYDVSGQLVRTLDMGQKGAGAYTIHWDGKNQAGQSVASGVYFYSMKAGYFSSTRKMLMLR